MTDAAWRVPTHSRVREMLTKVPEITIYFWVIKVLCTTVGETAADFLNVNLNLGLTGTSVVTGVLLVAALVFQLRWPARIRRRSRPRAWPNRSGPHPSETCRSSA
jgi:uncharacterized membrane-anchored protein